MPETVGVGIVGFGFMGRTHAGAVRWARERAGLAARVVAVADERGAGAFAASGGNLSTGGEGLRPDEVTVHTEAGGLLADERVSLVCVCTPTATHVDLAVRALESGRHVLVEKPVGLTVAEVSRLARAAEGAAERGLLCVPAMCMRYWPGWAWLRETIAEGSLGGVRSMSLTRLGAAPSWSAFYADDSRSGGAILDLHVHDVDFVLHCFGVPWAVSSRGDSSHVATSYSFAEGPGDVRAEGGWLRGGSFPFRMRYLVEFERGVADFDLARPEPLLVHDGSGSRAIALGEGNGYEHQASAVVGAVLAGGRAPVTVDEAVQAMRVIEAERASLLSGGSVVTVV